ncbi:N-formylglutamate amidohydrolase [Phreatobacter sp. AB_2022a]|uniref:N-formylglutamate amidohydrolase n=1 Tax=Phreatobacter sp. AB_2022a TaxID=3003134 RepID=UPI00228741B6|nr:N-formylglutamate amidohydrolase [Phreatobacter sp. AB_2022a]MCZ0738608.1 N-formylglutamate amidohydrolase [Phreatobacter sp. AB_2022a]
MSEAEIRDFEPAFEALEPDVLVAPVVFNSPHSGRVYPAQFLQQVRLDLPTLRRSEDTDVDALFAGVVERGMPLVRAHFPRSMVDVNREPYELDPRMFDGRLPTFANTRSMRVAGGLGTVPRVVGEAQEIYARRLPVDEALMRIDTIYKPYHRTLRRVIAGAHRAFGEALLVDCHSMPSLAPAREDRPRADIVIGDRYGTSCSPVVSDLVESVLRGRGYQVVRNKPYAGGFITEHYGQPQAGTHAVQIEINRAIYMDERSYRRKPGFEGLQADLMLLAEGLMRLPLDRPGDWRFAAE